MMYITHYKGRNINRLNIKRSLTTYIMIKFSKAKDRLLWKPQETSNLSHMREYKIISIFLRRNLAGQETIEKIYSTCKKKKKFNQEYYNWKCCPSELEERVGLSQNNNEKLQKFITTRLALQEMLKGILQVEIKVL